MQVRRYGSKAPTKKVIRNLRTIYIKKSRRASNKKKKNIRGRRKVKSREKNGNNF